MLDDCHQGLLSTIQHILPGPQKNKILTITGFNAENYAYPLNVSLIRNRMYYLGKTQNNKSPEALYRSDHNQRREQILPLISSLNFSQKQHQLQIIIKLQTDPEPYYVSV